MTQTGRRLIKNRNTKHTQIEEMFEFDDCFKLRDKKTKILYEMQLCKQEKTPPKHT